MTTTPIGTLSYPHLYTAKANAAYPESPPKFSAVLIYNAEEAKEAIGQLWSLIKPLMEEKFPGYKFDQKTMKATTIDDKSIRLPFSSNNYKFIKNTTDRDDNYPQDGVNVNFTANLDAPPGIYDGSLDKIEALEAAKVYAGCKACISYHPYAYTRQGNLGISLNLSMLQKTGDGDPIGRAPADPRAAFSATKDGGGAGDAAGLFDTDGGIPF